MFLRNAIYSFSFVLFNLYIYIYTNINLLSKKIYQIKNPLNMTNKINKTKLSKQNYQNKIIKTKLSKQNY